MPISLFQQEKLFDATVHICSRFIPRVIRVMLRKSENRGAGMRAKSEPCPYRTTDL